MGFVGPKVVEQDFRDINVNKQLRVGTYRETVDGRGYRYTLAGASNIDPGKLNVAATVDSNATNKAVTAASAAGSKEVAFTAGGSLTANKYADGYCTVNDATGEGITYLVNSHNGGTAIVVKLEDPIKVALVSADSEVSLTQNPWSGAVISVTDQADMPIGVSNVSLTAAYYGWLQTKGVCAVWADAAFAAGATVTTGTGTAGQVQAVALTEGTPNTGAAQPEIGYALVAGVDTEYREVYLTID